MIHKKSLSGLDIDLFNNISVGIFEKMVKDFKLHRCALDFDSLSLCLIVKDK